MKIKSAVFGFIAGALSVATIGTAIGADTVVVGTLKPDIAFKVDGELSYAPRSMSPINYNGYTYVPVRYLSEMLGCSVEWNGYGDMVIIEYPEDKIKEVEKIVYVEKDSEDDKVVYSKLPASIKTNNFDVSVNVMTSDERYQNTKLYIGIENKNSENIQVVQDECTLTVDGKEYPFLNQSIYIDNRWYNDIKKDDGKVEGSLTFKYVPDDAKNYTLNIVTRNGYNERTTTTINFTK